MIGSGGRAEYVLYIQHPDRDKSRRDRKPLRYEITQHSFIRLGSRANRGSTLDYRDPRRNREVHATTTATGDTSRCLPDTPRDRAQSFHGPVSHHPWSDSVGECSLLVAGRFASSRAADSRPEATPEASPFCESFCGCRRTIRTASISLLFRRTSREGDLRTYHPRFYELQMTVFEPCFV